MEPGSDAVFRLNISYPNKLGSYQGEVTIHTSFDRQLRIPVKYKTAMGTLHLIPDKITFEPTFPVRGWGRGFDDVGGWGRGFDDVGGGRL